MYIGHECFSDYDAMLPPSVCLLKTRSYISFKSGGQLDSTGKMVCTTRRDRLLSQTGVAAFNGGMQLVSGSVDMETV